MTINHENLNYYTKVNKLTFWDLWANYGTKHIDSFKVSVNNKRQEVYFIETYLYERVRANR